jgi:hypothetical protein
MSRPGDSHEAAKTQRRDGLQGEEDFESECRYRWRRRNSDIKKSGSSDNSDFANKYKRIGAK